MILICGNYLDIPKSNILLLFQQYLSMIFLSSAISQKYCLSSNKVQSYCLKIILWAI